MSYASQLAAFERTVQYLVELYITSCDNLYASGNIENQCDYNEAWNNASWTKSGGTTTNTNAYAQPHSTPGDGMEKVNFAAVGDYIESNSSDDDAASQTFNVSCWLRADTGTGTVTLKVVNTAATLEESSVVCHLTETPQRFSVTRTFGAGAGGKVRLRVYRDTGDLAAVGAWGGQITKGAPLYNYRGPLGAGTTYVSQCNATDAGAGNRCWYSRPTCQDADNFKINTYQPTPGLKVFRFCRQDAPLAVAGEDIWPMLRSVEFVPQQIDPERAVTVSERVKLTFQDDAATWVWNQDKASAGGLVNTGAPSGTFWRRFLKIYRNYSNPRNYVLVKVGFVEAGGVLSDYQQRGKYLIDNLSIDASGLVTMELVSALRLLREKAPAKISESNLLNGAIDASTTSVTVDDASELTVPGSGYTVTIQIESEFMNVTGISGNVLTVQRGRWGSTAATHANDLAWKEVLMYGTERSTPSQTPIGKNPIDIIVELLQRGGIAAADIDTTTLYDERDTWLAGSADAATGAQSGILFKRAGLTVDGAQGGISIQQDINTYIRQVSESCMLSLWVGEDQRITGRIFAPARPSVALADITETGSVIKSSLTVDDNEDSRITRVVVCRDMITGRTGEAVDDYQTFTVVVGAEEEATDYYGRARTKVIYCPWIRSGDDTTAKRLGRRIFSRFRNSARMVSFDLEIKDDAIECGDFAFLTTTRICKADGTTDAQRIMQVVEKKRTGPGRLSLKTIDTGLFRRYGFIAPAGTPDYGTASTQQRRYGFIGRASDNQVGTPPEEGYYIWG
jgi:hypothetical protein